MIYRARHGPRAFQNDINDPGTSFVREFVNRGGQHSLRLIAMELRKNQASLVDCKVSLNPAEIGIGKRNVVFRIHFVDGSTWVARLRNPLVNKTVHKDQASRRIAETRSIESEVVTMDYVRCHSTIPVPIIHGYDCSYDNPVGCPYIFMEYINGKPLSDVVELVGGITDTQMLKIHAQLASVSVQLSRLSFPTIGQLRMDPFTKDVYVGEIIDLNGRKFGPFQSASEYYSSRAQLIFHEAERNFLFSGQEHFLQIWEAANIDYQDLQTAYLHTIAAASITSPDTDHGPFPLLHTDLHGQNVLIDDDWTVVGIIDWSWCSTVPLESFRPIPFNFAQFVVPYNEKLVKRQEDIFWAFIRHFECLEADKSVNQFRTADLRGYKGAAIASYLDRYPWPALRLADAPHLAILLGRKLEELISSDTNIQRILNSAKPSYHMEVMPTLVSL